jgi:ubiquitin carboxyl-terminal hydrolase 7
VWFDLVDYDRLPEACSLRVRKHTKFGELKAMVAQQLGVPVEKQRYWTWTKRQNNTIRLADIVLGSEHEDASLMDLREHADIVRRLGRGRGSWEC